MFLVLAQGLMLARGLLQCLGSESASVVFYFILAGDVHIFIKHQCKRNLVFDQAACFTTQGKRNQRRDKVYHTSTTTASPNPKPQAGISSLPNVESSLLYLPPPQIALSFPSLSKAYKNGTRAFEMK